MVDAGAAARTEHYEIAAYNSLIEMARALGESEAVGLLEENLKEGARRSTKSSPSPRSFETRRRRPPPERSIQVRGSLGSALRRASLPKAGRQRAANRSPV